VRAAWCVVSKKHRSRVWRLASGVWRLVSFELSPSDFRLPSPK
jgi:hypothetical protein